MILLLNSDNSLGMAVMERLSAKNEKSLVLKTRDFVDNLTVSYDSGGEFWAINGSKTYIKDFTAVYCGCYGSVANKYDYEDYYLASCWEAYLQYVLARIPRKLGVINYEFSLGNFLQLPIFYKIVKGFGLDTPRCLYRCYISDEREYYFCNTLYCKDISSFREVADSPLLVIEKKFNIWGKVLIIAKSLYFFTFEYGMWVERDLAKSTRGSIIKLLKVFSVTLGKIVLRYDMASNNYVLYGMTLNLSEADMRLLPKNIADVAICFLKR